MKSHDPFSGPEHEALGRWRVRPPRNPSFRSAVWARIRKRADETWPAYLRAHVTLVVTVTIVVMAVGALGGRELARAQYRSELNSVASDYVHSLDPRWITAQ